MTQFIDHDDPNHKHLHPDDCRSYAPRDELGSWSRFFDITIILTALITFILNMFVIFILISNYRALNRQTPRKRQSERSSDNLSMSNTHLSFISLSLSVILYSSICVPALYFHTIDDHESNQKSLLMFTFLKFLFYSSPIASSFVNLFMAFDRYLAIENLMQPKEFWYKRHYYFCLVVLWICSFLIIIPLFW